MAIDWQEVHDQAEREVLAATDTATHRRWRLIAEATRDLLAMHGGDGSTMVPALDRMSADEVAREIESLKRENAETKSAVEDLRYAVFGAPVGSDAGRVLAVESEEEQAAGFFARAWQRMKGR